MKLYATLETSRGKTVSVSDNESITATLYDGNMKAYSITIDWCNIGDLEEPTMGAIITSREWRNREKTNDKQKKNACRDCGGKINEGQVCQLYCKNCIPNHK
jgi:hypothetical protein